MTVDSPAPESAPSGAVLRDPYLDPGSPGAATARMSVLAMTSTLALLLGPLGAIVAMVVGLSARHEIKKSRGKKRGHALATASVVLGGLMTAGWGVFFGLTIGRDPPEVEPSAPVSAAPSPAEAPESEPAASPPPVARPAPRGAVASAPSPALAPVQSRLSRVGTITVLDAGSSTALEDELVRQLGEARAEGELVVVMTTRGDCDPCRGVDASLADPRMQVALKRVRLVRADIDAFGEDLQALGMPIDHYPGFFVLGPDGSPTDGVDGGEWDADIPKNIAPVLGKFVRGEYEVRRDRWQPPRRRGVTL